MTTAETLIEVHLLDEVTARSTETMRFFEDSIARQATIDVDNCFHPYTSDNRCRNGSVLSRRVLVMSLWMAARFRCI